MFVLQLSGRKRWRVAAAPAVAGGLPRLFERRAAPEVGLPGAREILLSVGDALYVPKGFAHEALAQEDDASSSGGTAQQQQGAGVSSCHVTFAVEVLPPFEAAAALHCAVRFIATGQLPPSPGSSEAMAGGGASRAVAPARAQPGALAQAAEALAHCAVRSLSDRTPRLRAALLVRSDGALWCFVLVHSDGESRVLLN